MSSFRIPIERSSASYQYDYFSGANIGLYVRDVLVGNALAVQFDLNQNKLPLYGYASDLWDGVAMGTVQCSGVLVVNFQFAQYIPTLIARAHDNVVSSEMYADKFSSDINKLSGDINYLHPQGDEIDPAVVLTPSQKSELRLTYWAGDTTSRDIHHNLSNTNLSRPDEHSLPFDVVITYGDAFGNELRRQDGLPSPTLSAVRTLRQVQIIGFGQQISVGGEPVREHYAFICRQVT